MEVKTQAMYPSSSIIFIILEVLVKILNFD
jgi:hypothetical protein